MIWMLKGVFEVVLILNNYNVFLKDLGDKIVVYWSV